MVACKHSSMRQVMLEGYTCALGHTCVAHLEEADEAVDGQHDEGQRRAAAHDDDRHQPLRQAPIDATSLRTPSIYLPRGILRASLTCQYASMPDAVEKSSI